MFYPVLDKNLSSSFVAFPIISAGLLAPLSLLFRPSERSERSSLVLALPRYFGRAVVLRLFLAHAPDHFLEILPVGQDCVPALDLRYRILPNENIDKLTPSPFQESQQVKTLPYFFFDTVSPLW